jgi:hypothetical protein
MSPEPNVVRFIAPLVLSFVALAFGMIGLFRPEFLWNLSKLQTGRRLLGDSGLSAFFIVLAVLLLAMAIFTFVRLGGQQTD